MALTSTLGRSTTWHTTCEGEGKGEEPGGGVEWGHVEVVCNFVNRCWM